MQDDRFLAFAQQLNAFVRRSRRERPAEGLTPSAFRMLREAARAGTACQPSQFAERLEMAPSNVAALLGELERAGCVRRERDAVDARRVNVSVTAQGHELLARARAERAEWLRTAAEATLDAEELETLLRAGGLLERIAAHEPESVR